MSHAENGNRIALDAMGSDLGPAEMVAAAALSLEEFPRIEPIVLVGREEVLKPLVAEAGLANHPKIGVSHASEVVEMTDKPLQALKRKKDSSMVRAIELLKEKQVRAVVSCGNTGALMAGGTLKLRMLEGVDRPALGTIIPRKTGRFVLIDAGANPEGRVEYLIHNAILGSNYCKVCLGVKRPRVGLLTIGTEEGKGNELINDTHEQLKRLGELINYKGPIEGFHVFDDAVDVVVCDGFVGNVVLKTSESLFHMLGGFLKEELLKDPIRKGGAFLAQGAFKAMKSQLNPDLYAGAPLLGVRGNIFKAHGSSNRHAVKNALRIAHEVIEWDLNKHIVKDIARANEVIAETV